MRKATLNEHGLIKVSPSALMNYYYPFNANVPPDVLAKAGARGNAIHECIEMYILQNEFDINLIFKEHQEVLYYVEENEEKIQMITYLDDKDLKTIELQFGHFKNYIDTLDLDRESAVVEHYVSELNNVHGYVDYHDNKQLIDWKTNSTISKKEVEKYGVQMNLYRYMIYNTRYIDITDLKLVHLTKKEELTPTFKQRKPEQLLKVYQIQLIPFEELELMIEEVYNHLNKEEV